MSQDGLRIRFWSSKNTCNVMDWNSFLHLIISHPHNWSPSLNFINQRNNISSHVLLKSFKFKIEMQIQISPFNYYYPMNNSRIWWICELKFKVVEPHLKPMVPVLGNQNQGTWVTRQGRTKAHFTKRR